jgi:hypothetical protein
VYRKLQEMYLDVQEAAGCLDVEKLHEMKKCRKLQEM